MQNTRKNLNGCDGMLHRGMRGNPHSRSLAVLTVLITLAASPVSGQTDPPPSPTTPTTQPVAELKAKVVEVSGDVKAAPLGAKVLDAEAWKAVDANDELTSGTQIRTGLRSYVVLLFGDDTVVSVRRATLASIDQFYRDATTQTIRLGLGYGAVRGGTTEGELRSDVIVNSPVATLAKRGTEGWEMEVAPYTHEWRISLSRQGLVQALQRATGQRRLVRPGEYADNLNIATLWVKQSMFDRAVKFVPAGALTRSDVDFSTQITGGLATVAPGAGAEALQFSGRAAAEGQGPVLGPDVRAELDRLLERLGLLVIEPGRIRRPEGHFGVRPFSEVRPSASDSAKRRYRRR